MKAPAHRIHQVAALCILVATYSPVPSTQGQTCAPVPAGLVGWWRGESGSDFIGNSPITILHDLGFATGKVGQAFDFNGSTSSLNIPASPTLHVGAGGGFSIETWIKATTIDLQRPIVEWNSVTGGNPYPYGVHLWISVPVGYGDGPGCLYANVVDTDGAFHSFTSAGGVITTNTYQHVALTYDRASGQASLYLDGHVVASQNLGTFTPQTSYNLYLGNRPDAGPGNGSWAGQMDEVSIYNRALSSNEIAGIFLAANTGKCLTTNPPPAVCTPTASGLVSWWRGEANALDQAGANSGTLAGNTTFASGRVGQGFVFDGNGSVVQLGSPASLQFQDLTVETWIRRASTAVTSLNGNGNGVIFGYNIGGYGLYLDPSGTPTLSKIGINEVKPGVTITDTNLHHVAVTKVGSTVAFYVDGVAYPAAAYDPGFTFSEDAFIGGLGNNYTFYGTVDEMSVYNRGLFATEIQSIYAAGSAGKCTATNPPVGTEYLLNVNFGAHLNPGSLSAVKTGRAATGATTNDFWNFYSRDGASAFDWLVNSVLPSLKLVDGTPTTVGLVVNNAPGCWSDGSSDAMYNSYIYPFDSGNAVVTVTNLPTGQFDVYVYGPDGNYELAAGSVSQGIQRTLDATPTNPPVWIQGVQYARFTNVNVSAGQPLVVTVRPGIYGHAVISGMQVAGQAVTPPSAGPVILSQPQNSTVLPGASPVFSISASGSAPLSYQWRFNGTNIAGATFSSLSVPGAQKGNQGWYEVVVSNPYGSVTSFPRRLSVSPGRVVSWGWNEYGQTNVPTGLSNAVAVAGGELHSLALKSDGTVVAWGAVNAGNGEMGSLDYGQAIVPPGLNEVAAIAAGGYHNLALRSSGTVTAWGAGTNDPGASVNSASLSFRQNVVPAGLSDVVAVAASLNSSLALKRDGTVVAWGNNSFGQTNVPPGLSNIVAIAAGDWHFLALKADGTPVGWGRPTYGNASVRPGLSNLVAIAAGGNHSLALLRDGTTIGWGEPSIIPPNLNNVVAIAASFDASFAVSDTGTVSVSGSGQVGELHVPPGLANVGAVAAGGLHALVLGTVPLPPLIVLQPTNVTVYAGSNVTLRVFATGDALSYQWRYNGSDLPGKTSRSLSLTNVQFSNAGPYSVVVSDAGGSVTSSNAILTVNPLPNCDPPPTGLVSWWRAENDARDNWGSNDATGNTSNGRGFAVGKVGQAFAFPAISVTDALSLHLTNGLTVEAWVNPSRVIDIPVGTIVSKFDYANLVPTAKNSSFFFGITNNGRLFFVISTNGSPRTNVTVVAPQPLAPNQWSHVAATYNASNLSLYVNGQLVADLGYTGGIFPGDSNLGIGALPFAGQFVQNFSGLLDEVALYNRALTDSEIQAIYHADVVGKCLVPPTIVTQPESQAIPLGEDVKFTVSVLGSRPLKYQWRFNGTNLLGATNSALVLEKVKTNQAGFYHVAVTNALGFDMSMRAQLSLLPAPTCTDTPAGLVSWWPADGNQFDAMGTNNIATFSPTLYVSGKVDRAFSFNGTSSRVIVNNSASVNFGSNADFSIEMWIKAGANNSVNPDVPLLEKRGGDTFWVGYSLSLNQGHLAFAMGSSPVSPTNVSRFISPGPDLRDAMFHHVAVSVNRTATNGGNLYVDGQLVLTFDPTPRKGNLVTSTPLYMGAPASTIPNSYFSGLIDEPAIYNRALSAAEIQAIRQAGAAGKCKVKPAILVQPVSQRATVGSNITFSVIANGSPMLRYQWLQGTLSLFRATNSSYTITNASFERSHGPYSCRVTNLFGAVLSSNAVLTVNRVPSSLKQAVSLNEDTPTPTTLTGTDPDNDPLTYVIVTPPAHGALSGSGSNQVYTPSLDYYGPDSFTFKVNDGLVNSASSTISLTILPVNDPPVAISQSVALNEDTSLAITFTGSDAEGDPLTFATVSLPAHGTLTGPVPNLTYRPDTNYFGPDSFTFKVNDGQVDSTVATVSLNVISSPDAPVAKAMISPLAQFPGLTNLVVISPNNTNATVVLDGSLSTDVENDPLQCSWLEVTNVFATGVLATNVLEVGTHLITLAVSDGTDTATDTLTVDVITPAESVEMLNVMVNEASLPKKLEKELMGSLKESAHAFDKNKLSQGIKRLTSFQEKVRKRIALVDQALADSLINGAQVIVDALTGS